MTDYHVGTSGWHYEHWRALFYPENLPKTKWLRFYTRHFATVEVNNTFYRLPSEDALAAWNAYVPGGFRFALKASCFITHVKRLRGVEEAVRDFTARASALGDRVGPMLFQIPPQMHRNDRTLEAFLRLLPPVFHYAFEFQHASWFDERVYELLRKYGVALCIYDLPDFTTPVLATSPFAYVRFHGPSAPYSSKYDDGELHAWAERIRALSPGVRSTYVYFNNDAMAYAEGNAMTMARLLVK